MSLIFAPHDKFRALLCAALLVCGCGSSDHALEGSLTTLLNLEYQDSEIVQSLDELTLRFIQKKEVGEDTVFKITVNLLGTAAQENIALDLAEKTPSGSPRARITRDVLDDPRRVLPAIGRGALTFKKALQPQSVVPGEFNITFTPGTQFGAGHTVFGSFEATLP